MDRRAARDLGTIDGKVGGIRLGGKVLRDNHRIVVIVYQFNLGDRRDGKVLPGDEQGSGTLVGAAIDGGEGDAEGIRTFHIERRGGGDDQVPLAVIAFDRELVVGNRRGRYRYLVPVPLERGPSEALGPATERDLEAVDTLPCQVGGAGIQLPGDGHRSGIGL